ncbi:MAG TPA: NAD(P)-binding domain-containing protein [bacterium]|nr:NAD(P)-binding domain-containing protein [bacterium]
MNKKKILIGFIGQGFIGRNMADDFADRGYNIVRYNKSEFSKNKELIGKCDIVFIAVPTPSTSKGFDDSILLEVVKLVGDGKIVVIKSTIKVGTTEKIQKTFPKKFIMHSPEFLTEKNAKNDAKFPERNIIGYTKKSEKFASLVLSVLPDAKNNFQVPCREAELCKYVGNTFLMMKVIFANAIFNLAKEKKINYDKVIEMVGHDSRIGHSHLKIKHQGGVGKNDKIGRGAGGHCFIKDMAALIEMYKETDKTNEENELASKFLQSAVKFNNRLLLNSKKDLDLLFGVYGKIK